MSHLKKMGLDHNIQWSPLVIRIVLGIAQNSRHNSLFEPFSPIITLPQLELPTHAISVVKKIFEEFLLFGSRPAVAIANFDVG